MDRTEVLLRAHHVMCIHFFKGEGYSGDFTLHMAEVIAGLTPFTPVKPVCGPDAICAGCPNLSGGVCASQSKVMRYDKAVLEACGAEEGRIMPWGELKALVERRVIAQGKRPLICSDCEWNDICR